MDADRDLGDFWKVQAQLAQTLQLELARALAAARIAAKPSSMLDMERAAQSLLRCCEVYDMAQWRLNGNERAEE